MERPYLRLLSENDLKSIHNASLKILKQTGMIFDHPDARDLLEAAGAKVDHDSKIVKFSPEFIEKQLKLAPRKVVFHGRTPEYDFTVEPQGDIYARMPGGATVYVDLKTGEHRRAKLDDWKELARLADALPSIHCIAPFWCGDVPLETADIHSLQVVLEHQRKPIVHNASNLKNYKVMIEMMLAVRGSKEELQKRPLVNLMVSPIAPLFWNKDDLGQLLLACEYGIPADIPIMPVSGTTGPITLAGTLALANAEFLGTIALVQTARPGYEMPYFCIPLVADMKTCATQFSVPETGLLIAALAQLSHELYGLPGETIGINSDGYITEQLLFERAQNAVMASLSGSKLFVGPGALGGSMALSPVQLVIDNEILQIARRWVRGITVNEDTLAVDVVHRVGPRGHFLADDHTMKYLRTGEITSNEIFDRDTWETWTQKGQKDLLQKAREKALAILEEHKVEPLPEDVSKELKLIVSKADKDLTN